MKEISQLTETAWLENELREAERKAFEPVYGLNRKQRRTPAGKAAVVKAEKQAHDAKQAILVAYLQTPGSTNVINAMAGQVAAGGGEVAERAT